MFVQVGQVCPTVVAALEQEPPPGPTEWSCEDQNGFPRPREGTLQRSGRCLGASGGLCEDQNGFPRPREGTLQRSGRCPEASGRHSAKIRSVSGGLGGPLRTSERLPRPPEGTLQRSDRVPEASGERSDLCRSQLAPGNVSSQTMQRHVSHVGGVFSFAYAGDQGRTGGGAWRGGPPPRPQAGGRGQVADGSFLYGQS
jgi:hypothetical protein